MTYLPQVDQLLITRRLIPKDDNCLFTSICYLLECDRSAIEMRQLCVDILKKDYELFQDPATSHLAEYAPFQDFTPAQYEQFILDPRNWGGGLECRILSDFFGVEIAIVHINAHKIHVFGEDKKWKHRIYLLYTGTHYDALIASMDPGDETSFQVRVFDSDDDIIKEKMLEFAVSERVFITVPMERALCRHSSGEASDIRSSCDDDLENDDDHDREAHLDSHLTHPDIHEQTTDDEADVPHDYHTHPQLPQSSSSSSSSVPTRDSHNNPVDVSDLESPLSDGVDVDVEAEHEKQELSDTDRIAHTPHVRDLFHNPAQKAANRPSAANINISNHNNNKHTTKNSIPQHQKNEDDDQNGRIPITFSNTRSRDDSSRILSEPLSDIYNNGNRRMSADRFFLSNSHPFEELWRGLIDHAPEPNKNRYQSPFFSTR